MMRRSSLSAVQRRNKISESFFTHFTLHSTLQHKPTHVLAPRGHSLTACFPGQGQTFSSLFRTSNYLNFRLLITPQRKTFLHKKRRKNLLFFPCQKCLLFVFCLALKLPLKLALLNFIDDFMCLNQSYQWKEHKNVKIIQLSAVNEHSGTRFVFSHEL